MCLWMLPQNKALIANESLIVQVVLGNLAKSLFIPSGK